MMQKGSIGVTTENIFPVIKKFLYSDHEIFLRELVSNAVDATQKLKTLASCGEYKDELGELKVTVSVDAEKGTLTVSDAGIGMTAEDIDKYILTLPFCEIFGYGKNHTYRRPSYRQAASRTLCRLTAAQG